MNLEHFPMFIRTFYPQLSDISLEEVQGIGEAFKTYLEDMFKDKMDKLEDFWNIDPLYVVMNMEHPTMMNGYHPALVYHFSEFVAMQAEDFKKENPEEAERLKQEYDKNKSKKQ